MRTLYLATVSALAFSLAAPAHTQEVAGEVGTIVVTAQKRKQSLQDVPVSVSTYTADTLDQANVRDIKDLTQVAPGLVVTTTTDTFKTTARIRGIGTVGENSGLESSVGVVIDGIHRPRNGVGFGDLGPLSRIEVLRGPQGTLFGKNTSAGVINVISEKPYFNQETELEFTVNEHNGYGASINTTGPISEDTAYRFYAVKRERDGYERVVTGGGDRPTESQDENFYSLRGQILTEPNADLSVRIIADLTHAKQNCCTGVTTRVGSTAVIVGSLSPDNGISNPADPNSRITYANRPHAQKVNDYGISGEVEWENDWGTLTSITSLRFWDMANGMDVDFTTADIMYRDPTTNGQSYETFSQEFRLQGDNGPLDWMLGFYFTNEDHVRKDSYNFGSVYGQYFSLLATGGADATAFETATGLTNAAAFPTTGGQRDIHEQNAQTIAMFTHNTYDFSDKLTGVLGLRLTHDKKEVASTYGTDAPGCAAFETAFGSDPAATAPTATLRGLAGLACLPWARSVFDSAQQERSETEWSGTAKLQYDFSKDVMGYVSYALGYKAGGFNLDRNFNSLTSVDTSFDGEFVDSYEIGAKTIWMDRRLLLNITGFYQQYKDFQLNTFTGTSFIVYSIPDVESLGAEMDFIYKTPIDGLKLLGGATYTETEYGDDQFSIGINARGPRALERNLPGSRLSLAPKWTLNMMGDYERFFKDGTMIARFALGGRYTSGYNTGSDLLPFKYQDAYTVLDARVSIAPDSERWSFEIWADNLLDEVYKQVAFSGPFQGNDGVPLAPAPNVYDPAADTISYGAFLGAPRTIGATFRYRYN